MLFNTTYLRTFILYNYYNINYYNKDEIYTIANYRRDFNDKYCTEVDVLMWGETDSLIPHSSFQILDMLHDNNINQNIILVIVFL